MEDSSSPSCMYKHIGRLIKQLDEHRKKLKTVDALFGCREYEETRQKMISQCESLMLADFGVMGRKAKDILWVKGYHVPITICRSDSGQDERHKQLIESFLVSGIRQLKRLVLTFDREFNLELKDTINFEILQDTTAPPSALHVNKAPVTAYAIDEVCYAWDIVYHTVIAIGDMYRYYLNFNFSTSMTTTSAVVTQETVAAYYREAFKLNDKAGGAQNQLGTLFSGEQHEIVSTFHYLFAMACKEPSELSAQNVCRIFSRNTTFLQSGDTADRTKSFIARFLLIVDIFYFDKEVTDFCLLCHAFLVDLKHFVDEGDPFFTDDVLFKMTSILLFCLDKIIRTESKKIDSMNAVLVALTSDFVDSCNKNFDLFKSTKEAQNLVFNEKYNRIFAKFEEFVAAERSRPRKSEKPAENEEEKTRKATPESSNSSNKENFSQNGSQSAPGEKSKSSRRRLTRRRRGISHETDSEDEELPHEKFHFSDTDSNASFSSFDGFSDNSSDDDDDDYDDENGLFTDGSDEIIVLADEIISPEVNEPVKKTSDFDLVTPFEELNGIRFRKAYAKVDPNIIIEFCLSERTLKALKILFNWLDTTPDVLISVYKTNPELVHKIMRLINALNIDIFTRKVYFDRSFITASNMREDLRHLFDTRIKIPVDEDLELKSFALLQATQSEIDWEIRGTLKITRNENIFLRMFKIIDFGFHLVKMRKFHYIFCAISRNFVEKGHNKVEKRQKKKNRNRDRRQRYERNNPRRKDRRRDHVTTQFQDIQIQQHEPYPALNGKTTGEKMAELRLRNEVSALERKMDTNRNISTNLTPYIVLDTKALVNNIPRIREFERSQQFIILIPKKVLNELDELKKTSDRVRDFIKWLEKEFKRGNRFIRAQRTEESKALPFLKIPKKLDRDTATFMQIVEFCHYMVTETSAEDMLTLVTGENLKDVCYENFSCCGILNSIDVKYDQISSFYMKYKHKK